MPENGISGSPSEGPASFSPAGGGHAAPDEAIREVRRAASRIAEEVHKVIVGQDDVLEQVLIAMFCGGHAVVEGVPGLAKTLLISTVAKTLSLGFSRIQFTPDLMPSDMTGTEVIEEDKATGSRQLRFVRGPIFANVVLADEINRTPPKTQAALLEAMQERQVSVGGVPHKLPTPFFVLATQNPIEQEGTYPLPKAQLDRFMLDIRIGYPSEDEELEIVRRTTEGEGREPQRILSADECLRLQQAVRSVPVADHVARYALRIVRATRLDEPGPRPAKVREYLRWGAGPRASQFLVLAAKAKAALAGDPLVTPEHLRSIALPVLRHRLITNFNAEADGVGVDDVVRSILEEVPVERDEAARLLDSATR